MNKLGFRLRSRLSRFYKYPLFIFAVKNYFRYWLPFMRRFKPLYGVTAVLSVTYRCQCRCPHCGAGLYRKSKEEELSKAEMFSLIDRLAEKGAACVHFFGGEPLVAENLLDYIRRACGNGMRATLDTNGLLLDEKMIIGLKSAGASVVRVSLDSPDAAEHDRLRGVPGIFDKAVDGLRLCLRHGLECYGSLYATSENLADGRLEKMIALVLGLGAKARILSSIRSGRWLDRPDAALSAAEISKLRELLNRNVCWETEFLNDAAIPFWCNSVIKNKFDISPYGDVQACCYLPLTFGNVRREPVEAVVRRMWDSELLKSNWGSFDCPLNDPAFDSKYGSQVEAELLRHRR